MINPNEKQIGGDHYQAEYQHWDFVADNGLGYLEGCATKYLARWPKKNGLQDLQKALHYCEKMRSLAAVHRYVARQNVELQVTRRFCAVNDVDYPSSAFIDALCTWSSWKDLDLLCQDLQAFIEKTVVQE
jgi:hypothetical protein